jgi:hypothetical protein
MEETQRAALAGAPTKPGRPLLASRQDCGGGRVCLFVVRPLIRVLNPADGDISSLGRNKLGGAGLLVRYQPAPKELHGRHGNLARGLAE